MDLAPEGIDLFYIDESERHPLSVATCVRIPYLVPKKGGGWEFVWNTYLDDATDWRRDLSANHSIRFREELHGYQILGRKGLYHKTWRNLTHDEAVSLYADALKTLTWLPDKSIMSSFATDQSELMGHKGIFACLFGLFQRIRNQCGIESTNGMIFFDEGHKSYIRLYRMAQKYLPTGSKFGGWEDGKLTKSTPNDVSERREHQAFGLVVFFTDRRSRVLLSTVKARTRTRSAFRKARRKRPPRPLRFDSALETKFGGNDETKRRHRSDSNMKPPSVSQGRLSKSPTHSSAHQSAAGAAGNVLYSRFFVKIQWLTNPLKESSYLRRVQ